jgi:hypothetical protein
MRNYKKNYYYFVLINKLIKNINSYDKFYLEKIL